MLLYNIYLKDLETSDVVDIIKFFSKTGEVHSPLYGRMPANKFYRKLFSDSQQSIIILLHFFQEVNKPDVAAAHFRDDWKMRDGSNSSFEYVDVFYLDGQNKIKEVHIIYDTWHTRSAFEGLK